MGSSYASMNTCEEDSLRFLYTFIVAQHHVDTTQTTAHSWFGHTELGYGTTFSLWICHYLIFTRPVKDRQAGFPEDTKTMSKHGLWERWEKPCCGLPCGVQAESIARWAAWWKGPKAAAAQAPTFQLTLSQSNLSISIDFGGGKCKVITKELRKF